METYSTKAMANNIIKINPKTPDSYRKLVHHLRNEQIIHHAYQLKEKRAYRRLQHSIPTSEIKDELEKQGHKVRNVTNVKHRVSKEPLSLHFVDIEPQRNNKEIFNIELLQHIRIKDEPQRTSIVQCTRCQDCGHSKTYCRKQYSCVKCGGSHDTKFEKKKKKTAKPEQHVYCAKVTTQQITRVVLYNVIWLI
jgi:hypothetical protein